MVCILHARCVVWVACEVVMWHASPNPHLLQEGIGICRIGLTKHVAGLHKVEEVGVVVGVVGGGRDTGE